jgi:signal transduction histidine kinase
MPGIVNWLARVVGFAWLGIVAFVLFPARGSYALPVQVACYCLLGTALVAWALTDALPAWARHRSQVFPVILGVLAAAGGFASATGGGGTALVAFGFVAALVAGADTSLTAGLAVSAVGVLAIEIVGLASGDAVALLLGFPLLVVSGLLIGRNWGAYRVQAEQSAALLGQREQLQTEQRRADLLDERARIAREIHDVLAHSLGALGIQIQAARAVLTDHKDIDRADELLAAAQRMAADGLIETRRAVHALRAGTRPLADELAQASDTHAQRYRVPASFDTAGLPAPLPPDATVTLLRIAQESLVNAAKHAAGQPVAVRLEYGEADVRLTIRNDLAPDANATRGTPASVGEPGGMSTVDGGYGLTGMRERLRLLNGTLHAGRHDSQWIVTAELPRLQSESVKP